MISLVSIKVSYFILSCKKIMRKKYLLSFILILLFITGGKETFAQWQEIPNLQYAQIYSFLTIRDSLVFVGGDNALLLRSTDAGSAWQNVMGNGFYIDTVLSLGKGLGYVFAGSNGAGSMFRSSDDGKTWSPANTGLPPDAEMNAFTFAGSKLFAATDRGVYSSADSGRTWKADTAGLNLHQLYPGQGGGTVGITTAGSKLYTIASDAGEVFSSSVDTVSWTQVPSPSFTQGFDIDAIDTNIFIATQKGIYLYGGNATWIPRNNGLPGSNSPDFTSCILTNNDIFLIAYISKNSFYYSMDLGQNWKQVNDSLFKRGDYVNAIAVDNYFLFAGTQNGGWRIPVSDIVTSVKNDEPNFPKSFYLYQNYPNPFNPTTTIRYEIPKASFVSLKIYDLLGREVATLVNGEKNAGSYEAKFDGSKLSSGIYFYRMKAGSFINTKKFVLLK